MKTLRTRNFLVAALMFALALAATLTQAADPLPSWNDGQAKQAIVSFVQRVSTNPEQ